MSDAIDVIVYQTHTMSVDFSDGQKTYYRNYDGKWEVGVWEDGKYIKKRAHSYKVLEDLFNKQRLERVEGEIVNTRSPYVAEAIGEIDFNIELMGTGNYFNILPTEVTRLLTKIKKLLEVKAND